METDRRVRGVLDSESKHGVSVVCLPAAEEASRRRSLKIYLARLGTTKTHLAPPKGLFINYVIICWAFSDPHPLPGKFSKKFF